jgi:hypothetical protein
MVGMVDKLADVTWRITESEARIAAEQARLEDGSCTDPALSAIMLESSEATVKALRSYKARLEDLIAVNARRVGAC